MSFESFRALGVVPCLPDRQRGQPERQRRVLPDLVFFMLATGVRIGEALAVVWSQVDFQAGTVHITSTLVRVKGEGGSARAPRVEPGKGLFRRLRARSRCSGAGS